MPLVTELSSVRFLELQSLDAEIHKAPEELRSPLTAAVCGFRISDLCFGATGLKHALWVSCVRACDAVRRRSPPGRHAQLRARIIHVGKTHCLFHAHLQA